MQIKAILFDFDGTLANTVDLIVATFEHTCRTMLGTVPPRAAIVNTFGLPLGDAMLELSGREELVEQMRDVYREYNNMHHDEMIKPIAGVQETLAALKAQGLKIAVVTSKKQPMVLRGISCLQLEQYIDAVIALRIRSKASRTLSRCWRHVQSWALRRRNACALAIVPSICRADVMPGRGQLPCAIRPLLGRKSWKKADLTMLSTSQRSC